MISEGTRVVRMTGARFALGTGYAVGLAGYVIGLIAPSLFDLPTGAVIVCALAALLGIAAFTRPQAVPIGEILCGENR